MTTKNTASKFKVGDSEYETRRIGDLPYLITKCGEVISIVKADQPKILKGGLSHGYRTLILTRPKERIITRHHYLVMRWFVGPRPAGMVINHKNCIKTDNRLENLEYCTPKQNRDHAKVNRLYKSGSKHPFSKLDEETVLLIKRAAKIGMSRNQLARAFGVSKKAINQIFSGKSWQYAESDISKRNSL